MSSNSTVGLEAEIPPERGLEATVLGGIRKHAPRVAKSTLGIAVCSAGVWFVLKRFFLCVSRKAVVGAALLTLHAPIDGHVQQSSLTLGRYVEAKEVLGVINNPWADDQSVRALELQLGDADVEIASISPLLEEFEGIASSLKNGTALYQARRVAQLQAVAAEAEARIKAQEAMSHEAQQVLDRSQELAVDGLVSPERRSEVERDAIVGKETVEALQRNLDGIGAQLDAAQKGVNIDSSGMGSDRPYSRQRLDELRIELVRWRQRLTEQQKRRDTLVRKLAEVRARLQQFSQATLSSPRRGRIWEVLTAPDTYVSKGSPVVSILNCEELLVVATVSEWVFARLSISTRARFTVTQTGERHLGRVVELLGSEPLAQTLVAPGLLTEPGTYRVVLAFPSLAGTSADQCSVGQSGEVTFL
jgi:multidrug resistance efflux pump